MDPRGVINQTHVQLPLLHTPVRGIQRPELGLSSAGRGRQGRIPSCLLVGTVAVKQRCDDLRQFAMEVRRLGYSLDGGAGEWECLDLSDRMLAAVRQADLSGEPAKR